MIFKKFRIFYIIKLSFVHFILTSTSPSFAIKSLSDYPMAINRPDAQVQADVSLNIFHHAMVRFLMSPTDYEFKRAIDSMGLGKTLFKHQFLSEEYIQRAIKSQSIRYLVEPNEASVIFNQRKLSPVSPKMEGITPEDREKTRSQLRPQLKNNRLYRDVMHLALRMGFTEKAVENMRIMLVNGEENAYTTSGDKNRIDVFLTSDLYYKYDNEELLSIVGHEFGHVLAGHTNYTAIHEILWEAISILYLNYRSVNIPNQKGFSEFSNTNPSIPDPSYFQKKYAGVRGQIIYEGLVNLLEKPDHLDHLLKYLSIFMTNFENLHLSEEYRMTLTLVRNKLLSIKNIKGENIDFGNPNAFNELFEKVLQSISQSNEVTADNISASFIPNATLGRSLLRLHGEPGLEKNPFNKPSITVFKNYMKIKMREKYENARQRLAQLSSQELMDNYGGDHPNVSVRFINIYEVTKYPSIILANPFMQLIFTISEVDRFIDKNNSNLRNLELQNTFLKTKLNELRNREIESGVQSEDQMENLFSIQMLDEIKSKMTYLININDVSKNLYQVPLHFILSKPSNIKGNPFLRNTLNFAVVARIVSLKFADSQLNLNLHKEDLAYPYKIKELQRNREQYELTFPIELLKNISTNYKEKLALIEEETTHENNIRSENERKDLQHAIDLIDEIIKNDDIQSLYDIHKKLITYKSHDSTPTNNDSNSERELKPRDTQLQPLTKNLFPKINSCSNLF